MMKTITEGNHYGVTKYHGSTVRAGIIAPGGFKYEVKQCYDAIGPRVELFNSSNRGSILGVTISDCP